MRVRAFTQVEILVAVGVLAVGLLAVLGVLALGLRGSRTSQARTEAVTRTRQAIELIRSRDWAFDAEMQVYFADAPNDRPLLEDPPFEEDFSAEGYRRNIFIDRLAASGYQASIARIRVAVYYKEGDDERKVELESLQREP